MQTRAFAAGVDPQGKDEMEDLLTASEVASILRVDVVTVQRLIRRGKIPATKIGKAWRVRRADVSAMFTEKRP
jgi:excisionase family DNA binding protein